MHNNPAIIIHGKVRAGSIVDATQCHGITLVKTVFRVFAILRLRREGN